MSKQHSLEVYLEKRASRSLVGRLTREDGIFIFEYDKSYAYSPNSIPIGPDLPLFKRVHKSDKLFGSFADRIPSRQNPAYVEYCEKCNISPYETNEIVLLSTIGSKGPSSFIFEGLTNKQYESIDYRRFRTELDLSLREFSSLFQVSLSTIQKLEKNESAGKEALRRIEIYDLFPEVALFEVTRNKKLIHSKKFEYIQAVLNERINFSNVSKKSN